MSDFPIFNKISKKCNELGLEMIDFSHTTEELLRNTLVKTMEPRVGH